MKVRLVGGAMLALVGVALAGCSSSSSSATTTTPTTTGGSGATTSSAPAPASVGAASPRDLGTAWLAAVATPHPESFCAYAAPGQAASCMSTLTVPAGQSAPTYKNAAVGNVVTQQNQAIINFTGTVCQGAQCVSNTDPSVGTADGTSFAEAFATANNPNSPNSTPFVNAAVLQNGRWYASGF